MFQLPEHVNHTFIETYSGVLNSIDTKVIKFDGKNMENELHAPQKKWWILELFEILKNGEFFFRKCDIFNALINVAL